MFVYNIIHFQDDDSEYGVRRSIGCEQLADWNAQLYEKSYVKCPLPNCGIMFHGATQIQNHYVNCTGVSFLFLFLWAMIYNH